MTPLKSPVAVTCTQAVWRLRGLYDAASHHRAQHAWRRPQYALPLPGWLHCDGVPVRLTATPVRRDTGTGEDSLASLPVLPSNLTRLSISELIAQLRARGSTTVRGKKADLVAELQVLTFQNPFGFPDAISEC